MHLIRIPLLEINRPKKLNSLFQGNHSLYFLFPNMGQVNSLMVRTHKTGYKLIVGAYAAESDEKWIDERLDSFYKEFGTANEMIFEQPT